MDIVKPRTLSGFMELLPGEQLLMERILGIVRSSYALYGFTPLDTPIIESSEVLLAKGGGETEKQIYSLTRGDSELALRFDLTVPLAKYVAAHYADLAFPFRRFQIGKVYRGERAQRGRFREFYQADIDIIGDGKLDLILQRKGQAGVRDFTYDLLDYLRQNHGYTVLGDKSSPEDIYEVFGVSKKVFKKAVGDLYKRHKIRIEEDGIHLTEPGSAEEK